MSRANVDFDIIQDHTKNSLKGMVFQVRDDILHKDNGASEFWRREKLHKKKFIFRQKEVEKPPIYKLIKNLKMRRGKTI